jgi:alanine dehydrogenase
MSRITGKVAFQDAITRYKGKKPLRLTVLGTGPAAYSAALAARNLEIPVQIFGRKEKFRSALEMDGISYYVIPDEVSQVEFIRAYLRESTLLITAARTPGKKAPLLIDEKSLAILPENAVVIDLAASQGGNVQGSKLDQVICWKNGILIVNDSGYPKAVPREASEAYSRCIVNLLREIFSSKKELLMEERLLSEMWITHRGVCNPLLFEELKKFNP